MRLRQTGVLRGLLVEVAFGDRVEIGPRLDVVQVHAEVQAILLGLSRMYSNSQLHAAWLLPFDLRFLPDTYAPMSRRRSRVERSLK